MKKINILFTIWATRHGGAEHYVLNIIKKIDKSRYNIIVFSDAREKGCMHQLFEENGAKIIYAKVNRYRHPFKHIRQLKEVIAVENIDIIHGNDDLNMIYSIFAKPKNVAFIAHSHTTNFVFTNRELLSIVAVKFFPILITRRANVRLCCSHEAGEAMYGRKVFEVVYNGVDLDKFYYKNNIRKEYRKRFGFADDDIVIGHVGRLAEVKNHVFILRILKELNNKKYRAVFVGNGGLKESLVQQAKDLGVNDRVMFLGDRDDTHNLYNMFDIILFPSFYEGLPVTLVEAQANGLPIIASSAISPDAKINDNFVFKSIEGSAKKWAEEIYKIDLNRAKPSQDMRSYSIETAVEKLDGIYKKESKVDV